MLIVDEVAKAIREKFTECPSGVELENFMTTRWGKTEEVYAMLRLVVKSGCEFLMDRFDQLPQSIRERLADSQYGLDQIAILDHYSQFGEVSTLAIITQMEGIAARVTEDAFWRSLGLTPFAKYAPPRKTSSYAEAVKARWDAGMEAARRQNATRTTST